MENREKKYRHFKPTCPSGWRSRRFQGKVRTPSSDEGSALRSKLRIRSDTYRIIHILQYISNLIQSPKPTVRKWDISQVTAKTVFSRTFPWLSGWYPLSGMHIFQSSLKMLFSNNICCLSIEATSIYQRIRLAHLHSYFRKIMLSFVEVCHRETFW